MLGQKLDTPGKNASSTKNSGTELNKNKRTLVKGPKPLQRFRFYLDIKNHSITSKLEGKIKELGGTVEFFLDREVTHVISDRPECAEISTELLNSPTTPRLRSVESQCTNESPLSSCESPATGRLRQKTRADAMLEKVRTQSTSKTRDPLQNAKLWGVPIWTVNKVFSWLERITASISVTAPGQKSRKVKIINISSPFVKFEPVTRNGRPVYKSIKNWPTIDLESNSGKAAFAVKSEEAQNQRRKHSKPEHTFSGKDSANESSTANGSRMTRKQRTRLSVHGGKEREEKQTIVGGYCEICHCEYREIGEHVRSEQHLNFVKNDSNFLELDSLISVGANVEAFLRLNGNSGKDYPIFGRRSLRKLNGKSSPEKCNGDLDTGYSPPVTRNKMPRTRSSQSNTSHHLRSRGQVWLSSAEDQLIKSDDAKLKTISSDIAKPKRNCLKSKRISADERLVADNKSYYKVEVMTTKLRSSGLGTKDIQVTRRTETPIPEESESEEQGLVVKFKRVRRSELSVLNDEAENFMFPRKDDPSFSDIETDEGPDTTHSSVKSDPSSDIPSSEPQDFCAESKRKRAEEETIETMSVDNFVNEIGLRRKPRKIYTEIEEPFDECSTDDILMEICEMDPGKKRKRSQGAVTSTPMPVQLEPVLNKNNGDSSNTTQVKQEEPKVESEAEEIKMQLLKDEQKFTFEMLPSSEPWYSTFLRQDKGEEFYTCTSDPADYRARFLLPYQLPYLVPLDPKVCIEDYLRKKRAIFNPGEQSEATASTSDGATGEENSNSTNTTFTSVDVVDGSLDGSSSMVDKIQEGDVNKPAPGRRRRRKSRFIKLGSTHPRKSPRQHASTLAILSSLIQQRKKRERKSHGESDNSRTSLGTIPEENSINASNLSTEEQQKEDQNAIELARAVEEILSAPMDDISEPELLDCAAVEIKHRPDAIELIQNFDKVNSAPRKRKTPLIRRKRKKNRTGWPKKKRLFVKRCERKSEDGNSSLPELEDSRLTEISMEDENGELEMCELEAEGLVAPVNEVIVVKSEKVEAPTTKSVLQCTERINNSVNNNSDLKIKEEPIPNKIPYNVTILDCKKPQLKRNERNSSSEEVLASHNLGPCVNVTLDKWENAEKVLHAKVQDNEPGKLIHFQPFVRVQKIENSASTLQNVNRRLRSSSSPERKPKAKKARIVASTSPRSPRKLRAPRGKWYRER